MMPRIASSMDMMLWQIRTHTHLLGDDSDERTVTRYRSKFTREIELTRPLRDLT
ncbi:MAG: hypothetical protein OEU51_07865 [Gammaproteobacteria bacterium]|nr:hypothetical protein [Gammaproteobacteria bacterium]